MADSLRDELLAVLLPKVEASGSAPTGTLIEAAAACIGAAAVCLGALPPEGRREAVAAMTTYLPSIVEKRADEIRSGAFDRAQQRRRH